MVTLLTLIFTLKDWAPLKQFLCFHESLKSAMFEFLCTAHDSLSELRSLAHIYLLLGSITLELLESDNFLFRPVC